ncbi:MAG: carboxypeptidase-like regulatory domain-containing protein [Candidatus Latescibacterota bacterium]
MNKIFLLLMGAALLVFSSCGKDAVTVPLDGGAASGSITGKIIDKAGKGVEGVTITIGGVSVLTNTSGQFTAENIAAGSYTLTPAKTGLYFLPQNRSVTLEKSQATVKDFISSTTSFGSTGHGGEKGYCAQCHSI